MRFLVDQVSRSSIHLQIKDQILYAISAGELRPGDPLPSIRVLEAEPGLNRNTIRRAYAVSASYAKRTAKLPTAVARLV